MIKYSANIFVIVCKIQVYEYECKFTRKNIYSFFRTSIELVFWITFICDSYEIMTPFYEDEGCAWERLSMLLYLWLLVVASKVSKCLGLSASFLTNQSARLPFQFLLSDHLSTKLTLWKSLSIVPEQKHINITICQRTFCLIVLSRNLWMEE